MLYALFLYYQYLTRLHYGKIIHGEHGKTGAHGKLGGVGIDGAVGILGAVGIDG
jgi:hypothetical protein